MDASAVLSPRARRAIVSEIRASSGFTLARDGLILRFDPRDIQTAYLVLIGPPLTPYEHCPYLFKLRLSPEHPKFPPRATYLTNNGVCRFNPNLYLDGTVCLSILGTWMGPGWQPSTIECVGQTIRSCVLIDVPLRCEPGYSALPAEVLAPYSRIVEFHSLRFALEQAVKFPPEGFAEFRDEIARYFVEHMGFYAAKLGWLAASDDNALIEDSYGGSVTAEYGATLAQLKTLYRELTGADWIGDGEDGGFDPTKRIWYAECEPELIARVDVGMDEEDFAEDVIEDVEEPRAHRLSTVGTILLFVMPAVVLFVARCFQWARSRSVGRY
jgi:ubiquitin-protein ligase